MPCAAARAHVKPVHSIPGFETGMRHGADIARFTRSFETVHEHYLTCEAHIAAPLRLEQNLRVRIGLVKAGFEWQPVGAKTSWPEIPRDRKQVRVTEDRPKRRQTSF